MGAAASSGRNVVRRGTNRHFTTRNQTTSARSQTPRHRDWRTGMARHRARHAAAPHASPRLGLAHQLVHNVLSAIVVS